MRSFGIRGQITALTLIPLLVVVISMEAYFLQDRFADLDNDLQEHGKLLARQTGQNHFNTKERRAAKYAKDRKAEFHMKNKARSRFLVNL